MWPIQLTFRLLISCKIFLYSFTLSNTSSLLTFKEKRNIIHISKMFVINTVTVISNLYVVTVNSSIMGLKQWNNKVSRQYIYAFKTYVLLSAINPLTPELNPSAQRCHTRFFTGDYAGWAVNFINILVNSQQMQQLFILFINYVW
jgi:hypothetical protein